MPKFIFVMRLVACMAQIPDFITMTRRIRNQAVGAFVRMRSSGLSESTLLVLTNEPAFAEIIANLFTFDE
jgi:hypothetical protein